MKDPRDSLVALGLNFTDERSCKHLSDTFMLHGPGAVSCVAVRVMFSESLLDDFVCT